jgi:O-antigen/teichoic acid export membrane protein
MTASVNFPAYIALAMFSNEIVALLYGPRWHDSVEYLRIFAAWGLLRSVGNPVGSLLYAVGRARLAFWWTVIVLVTTVPALWLGVRLGGLIGLAWTMVGLQALIFVPSWRYLVRPCCGVNFAEFTAVVLLPLALAFTSGMVAFATVWLSDITGVLRLLIGCCVGGSAYISLSFVFNRPWTDAMCELIGRPLHLPRA